MLIHIQQEDLSIMASRLSGAIEERDLAQLGLRVEDDCLYGCLVDKSMAAYCSLFEQKTEQDGEVFVPGKLFIDIVREFPKGELTLRKEASSLVISKEQQQIVMKLPLIEGAVWRKQPDFPKESQVCLIPCSQLAYMIEQVQFCINQECPRNYGTVAYLHGLNSKTLRLVGSDGFRLSYCDINCDLPTDFLDKGICISKKALLELYRMCHEGHESLSISLSNDQSMLSAKFSGYELYLLLSAIKYPNYQGVIPRELPNKAEVDRTQLLGVAKRILLAADKMKSLQLTFQSHTLSLHASRIGSTEGRELLGLDNYEGPASALSVNGRYLSEVLNTAICDRMGIGFDNHDKPIVILPTKEPKNCSSQHILVPLRGDA